VRKNAAAEGVRNASFRRGNAVKLDFPDESFDAVTSNYVYHNITGADKQALLMETLRVLKKGGTFAIHDLMSPRRYGDMQTFVQKLRDMGYERVTVAVNFSARQFGMESMVDDVQKVLLETQLNPRNLKLEVTEYTATWVLEKQKSPCARPSKLFKPENKSRFSRRRQF
jgi:ubiquinone/menaquinone biosynthesis C-methylase UbiE